VKEKSSLNNVSKERPNPLYRCRNPKVRLYAAQRILEAFIEKREKTLTRSKQVGSGFFKFFEFGKNFVEGVFFPKKKTKKKRSRIGDEILKALDDITRFYPIICQKEEEHHLAKQILEIILKSYHVLKTQSTLTSECREKVLKLTMKRTELGLPRSDYAPFTASLQAFARIENKPQLDRNFTFYSRKTCLPPPLSDREADVFRMKAISLVKNDPALFLTIGETMSTIRQAPIYYGQACQTSSRDAETAISESLSSSSRQSSHSNKKDFSIFTLEQMLSPFPGETLIVRGSFKHDPDALSPTTPLSDTFELTTFSIQTGFPYPSQHNGWALTHSLIPPYPHRPEKIPALFKLLERKESVADAFLHRTDLLKTSRSLLERKIDLIKRNGSEFVSLHARLIQAFLKLAPKSLLSKKTDEIVQGFFHWLRKQDNPFAALSIVYWRLTTQYLERPNHALLGAWLKQSESGLYSEEPKIRQATAKKVILNEIAAAFEQPYDEDIEKAVGDFIRLVGKIFGVSSVNLFLQYFSETLESAPPQLSRFEKALQSVALLQQENFFNELKKSDPLYDSFFTIQQSLLKEISLFQKTSRLHPLSALLEKYYARRFTESVH